MRSEPGTECVGHEPCPACGSTDNLGRYADGSGHCFGCGRHEFVDDGVAPRVDAGAGPQRAGGLLEGEAVALVKRGISQETCAKFRYLVGTGRDGGPVQLATYCDSAGRPVAQKVRTPAKKFSWVGEPSPELLFGKSLWAASGRRIVVTEGEIDCLSYAEATQCRWPVVSVPNGAQSAAKTISANLEFLEGYEEVVIAFDSDEPGQKAAITCAELLTPGKARLVDFGEHKDANGLLLARGPGALSKISFEARPYRPDDLKAGTDLWDLVSTDPDGGPALTYPWQELQDKTRGLRRREIVMICAATGVGKSLLCREIAHHIHTQGEKVGIIALEESVRRSALGIMSISAGKPLHLAPDVSDEELLLSFKDTLGSGHFFFHDHFGSMQSNRLLAKIRTMAKMYKVGYVVLDHISIVVSGIEIDDERRALDVAMTSLRSLAEELNIGMIVVSHLKRTDRESAEVRLSDLRGSAALEQLSDIVIAAERDLQDEVNGNRLILRILKNRFSGLTGKVDELVYNHETGRLQAGILAEFG